MTRTEEIGQLLRIEYGFYDQYVRWYKNGRISRDEAFRKIEWQRDAVAKNKNRCREELDAEEYPEEFYLDEPLPFEAIKKPDALQKEQQDATKRCENAADGVQMNIYDYIQGEDIKWTTQK